jgi:hypothetical protein
MVAVAIGALAVYGRCLQVADQKSELLQQGFAEVAAQIGSSQPDYSSAEQIFQRAAGVGLGDSYGMFCFSATHELGGADPELGPLPDRWAEALGLVRQGRTQEAIELFQGVAESGHRFAARARFFEQFCRDLATALGSAGSH